MSEAHDKVMRVWDQVNDFLENKKIDPPTDRRMTPADLPSEYQSLYRHLEIVKNKARYERGEITMAEVEKYHLEATTFIDLVKKLP